MAACGRTRTLVTSQPLSLRTNYKYFLSVNDGDHDGVANRNLRAHSLSAQTLFIH